MFILNPESPPTLIIFEKIMLLTEIHTIIDPYEIQHDMENLSFGYRQFLCLGPSWILSLAHYDLSLNTIYNCSSPISQYNVEFHNAIATYSAIFTTLLTYIQQTVKMFANSLITPCISRHVAILNIILILGGFAVLGRQSALMFISAIFNQQVWSFNDTSTFSYH